MNASRKNADRDPVRKGHQPHHPHGEVMSRAAVVLAGLAAGFTLSTAGAQDLSLATDAAAVKATLLQSFKGRNEAGLDRLDQSEAQQACSEHAQNPLPPERLAAMEKAAQAQIPYPADGEFLGDWKAGQELAIGGSGMTYRDKKGTKVYGNCYACHQLETEEVSFGNIGPSLNGYGRLRGNSDAMLRYTWGRLYNSHAFRACNAMPRFGAAGILSEADLKDLMALLHDPESVVNK